MRYFIAGINKLYAIIGRHTISNMRLNYQGKNKEFLELIENGEHYRSNEYNPMEGELIFIWIKDECSIIELDGVEMKLNRNSILSLTSFHKFKFLSLKESRIIKFNKEFYCVLNHDQEVSCKGLLFYAPDSTPFINIPKEEEEKFEILWKMFEIEMGSKDELQLEMLQTMLKRFIILCTRIYKQQNNQIRLIKSELDIIREFNYLVESHFKTKHTVQEYAEILNKSAKTLANLFHKFSTITPLQIIQQRRMLEARRLLKYTDKSIKEIAYELEFEDIQTFSRFFKNHEQISPSEYRNS